MKSLGTKINKMPMVVKALIGAIIVIALLLLIVWVLQKKSQQTTNTSTSETLVTINGHLFSKNELLDRVNRRYKSEAITSELKKKELEVMIEEHLLEEEAEEKNISISTPQNRPTHYGELRQALFPQSIESIEGYVVSYSAPNNISNTLKTRLMAEQLPAFATARSELEVGGDPLIVAQRIAKNYPQFTPYLSINGVKYSPTLRTLSLPTQTITSQSNYTGISTNELLNITDKQTILIVSDVSPAAIALRALSVKMSNDYQTWLKDKKQKSVIYNQEKIKSL